MTAQVAAVLLGGIISVAVSVLLLLLAAVLVSNGMLGEDKQVQSVLAVCMAGAFLGGLFAGKRWGRRRLLAGILSGATAYLALLTVGLVCYGAAFNGLPKIGVFVCCICGGGIAGFAKSASGKKQKRRRR